MTTTQSFATCLSNVFIAFIASTSSIAITLIPDDPDSFSSYGPFCAYENGVAYVFADPDGVDPDVLLAFDASTGVQINEIASQTPPDRRSWDVDGSTAIILSNWVNGNSNGIYLYEVPGGNLVSQLDLPHDHLNNDTGFLDSPDCRRVAIDGAHAAIVDCLVLPSQCGDRLVRRPYVYSTEDGSHIASLQPSALPSEEFAAVDDIIVHQNKVYVAGRAVQDLCSTTTEGIFVFDAATGTELDRHDVDDILANSYLGEIIDLVGIYNNKVVAVARTFPDSNRLFAAVLDLDTGLEQRRIYLCDGIDYQYWFTDLSGRYLAVTYDSGTVIYDLDTGLELGRYGNDFPFNANYFDVAFESDTNGGAVNLLIGISYTSPTEKSPPGETFLISYLPTDGYSSPGCGNGVFCLPDEDNGAVWPVIGVGGTSHPFGAGSWAATAVHVWDPPGPIPESLFAAFYDGFSSRLARYDGIDWIPLAEFSGITGGEVCEILGSGNRLYLGGGFTWAEGSTQGFAYWNPSTDEFSPMPGLPDGAKVNAILVNGKGLFAGGDFPQSVRRWDGTTWVFAGLGLGGTSAVVNDLASFGGDIVAAGNFDFMVLLDGSPVARVLNVARLRSPYTSSLFSILVDGLINFAGIVGVNGSANAIVSTGSGVIVGGNFGLAHGYGVEVESAVEVDNIAGFNLSAPGSSFDYGPLPESSEVLVFLQNSSDLTAGTRDGLHRRSSGPWNPLALFSDGQYRTLARQVHGTPQGESVFLDATPQCVNSSDLVGRYGITPPRLLLFEPTAGVIEPELDLGTVEQGIPVATTLNVVNAGQLELGYRRGTDGLDIEEIILDLPENTDILQPGDVMPYAVTAVADEPGEYIETLVIETNDPLAPARVLSIRFYVRLPSDTNGDGVVDTADLGILIGEFGLTGQGLVSDLNGDGVVDTADLGLLIGSFGDVAGPNP